MVHEDQNGHANKGTPFTKMSDLILTTFNILITSLTIIANHLMVF
ncbi:unnamed protein product [Arabidopsis halleri]